MTKKEEQLIADYLAGESVLDELLEACDKNPELVKALTDHVEITRLLNHKQHAISRDEFIKRVNTELNQDKNQFNNDKTTKASPLFKPLLAACACMVFAVLILFNTSINSSSVGSISRLASATSLEQAIHEGQSVYKGNFSLNQGYAEITLNNGVTLVLEAPVELLFNSDKHIELSHGNLVARVPPQAIGFKVDTPSSNIIDLGTEFGVRVDKKGQSQVHVIEGEVKVKASDGSDYVHLIEDQARSFDIEQQIATIKSEPQRFMRSLPGKSADSPDFLHWPLDDSQNETMQCKGPGINSRCYSAYHRTMSPLPPPSQIIDGRFGDALYFNGQSNWLETEFPGIGGNKPRTIAFWVKVPKDFAITEGFGIISWGLSATRSAWQISVNPLEVSGPLGRVRIGTNQGEIVGSTDLRDDQWHHVAIVLFGGQEADLSTHALIYIDGVLENTLGKSIAKVWTELNHPDSQPVYMGKNLAFNKLESEKENRFFRGSIDEVYLFDSALNQPQIESLVEHNRLP